MASTKHFRKWLTNYSADSYVHASYTKMYGDSYGDLKISDCNRSASIGIQGDLGKKKLKVLKEAIAFLEKNLYNDKE